LLSKTLGFSRQNNRKADEGSHHPDRNAQFEHIKTDTGLKVECALDTRTYEKGIKGSEAEMAALDITRDPFHPEWNYTIKPRRYRIT
jgi:Rhodopirellula transposase DDE domain